ncbi:tumor necrosis factor receptor superfamily member 5 [Salarias fasciatus]|uniref:Tumor necrosis factor receptor superfamily member 5-like n=1 Tax=Salarias fasciatus TaxID=181472 RepID=A0A672GQ73_SALFA|nr:tumor necrosis factor receptor superfamily member 5-like [Salarias fasciatus]
MEMNCTSEDKYQSKDGRCCDRCPAGQYLRSDCSDTKKTECAKCVHGYFMATKNHLPRCQVCKECSPNNKQIKLSDCTATENTVCQCRTDFYCSNDDCDLCEPVAKCPPGEGVRLKATRTNNAVCAPCEVGTFSNVTDSISPCRAHTRCEDYGRVLETQGTPTKDAVCGNFKSHCSWMLPAGLWSGLVLTVVIVILVVLIIWRLKRKSYRTAVNSSPAVLVEVIPAPPLTPPRLTSHCQESCKMEECKLSIYNPDDTSVGCAMQDSSDISLLKTPLKTSVSFVESSHVNGTAAYISSSLLRSCSEPQEDEWCGT